MIVGPFPATLIAYKCTNVYLFAGHYETNNQHLFHNYQHQFHISCKLKLQFETNLMIMLCVQLHSHCHYINRAHFLVHTFYV